MGTIIDKLNRSKSMIEALCTQLNKTASDDLKVYNLKDIETRMSKIHLLRGGARITSGDVRKGKTFYDDTGILYIGTWLPYSGSTISASDIVKGKNAYDYSGTLLAGTHVCSSESSGSSENPYTLTVYNNTYNVKIVKSFGGANNNLTATFCEPGESYTLKVDLGSIIPFIFLDGMPGTALVNAPLYRIAPSTSSGKDTVADITCNGTTYNGITSAFPDLKDKRVYVVVFCMYYGANNTSITFR